VPYLQALYIFVANFFEIGVQIELISKNDRGIIAKLLSELQKHWLIFFKLNLLELYLDNYFYDF